ncbi:MAG: hypothetical protein JWP31_1861 [Aeromicrobium sp.]|nr:hypothetical protein [Aeromicrobium sp.]
MTQAAPEPYEPHADPDGVEPSEAPEATPADPGAVAPPTEAP